MVPTEKPDGKSSSVAQTLLLHPDDTVLVCISAIAPGDILMIDQVAVSATDAIQVGHKIARQALKPGDTVLKYGAPIGSITHAVPPGGHVHMHNMKSDYIASHSRDRSPNQGKPQP
ncbi:UxaA family hydrolase [Marinimicrobium sp. ABcell2]|uniref:UxaA family hydrolase n=1 Tax=Marinimicrobium sp. ABcell2 TaxID=3069751 RepID=UPI0027B6A0F1|nr:UxaA family hydrolase [Marinimicrobium sp. ABcell2]MDQ2077221.1 UxaA family hydrolase [Marinimicrobium sp. ABcell2]